MKSLPIKWYQSKNDSNDIRWGDKSFLIENDLSPLPPDFEGLIVLGMPDDLGIELNGGRKGASRAPDEVRKFFYKLTPSPLSDWKDFKVADFGDCQVFNDLPKTHQSAYDMSYKMWEFCLKKNDLKLGVLEQSSTFVVPIFIGGGHDFAYSNFAPFFDLVTSDNLVVTELNKKVNTQLNISSESQLGSKSNTSRKKNVSDTYVFNFDAHLDVRPHVNQAHSGTPFYRLLQSWSKDQSSRFFEVGIQPSSCSVDHAKWLTNQGGHILYHDLMISKSERFEKFKKSVTEQLNNNKNNDNDNDNDNASTSTRANSINNNKKAYRRPRALISIDMDVFNSALILGCSAPAPLGMGLTEFLNMFRFVYENFDILGIGIYELSPPLDREHGQSARLTAVLINQIFTELWNQKNKL